MVYLCRASCLPRHRCRGLIEAPVIDAMGAEHRARTVVFRGIVEATQRFDIRTNGSLVFRGIDAAASLKLYEAAHFLDEWHRLPRPRCRGLIEADSRRKAVATTAESSAASMPRPH